MKAGRFAILLGLIIGIGCLSSVVLAQSINQTQLRGTVTDSSGAIVSGAKVTITDVGTNISQTTTSNASGSYAFTALRASNYKLLVEAPAFGPVEKEGITLTVNQASTLNVTLKPASQQASVTVQGIPVLLDSGTATLGADIPSKYLTQIPLQNRDPFGIAFLAAGVTESAGSGINDSYPSGTNFISNGQRNSTADIRLDGVLITAPEQGEGGNSNTYYQATVEGLQEIKVQNNSFSAEYGGGTIIDEVMKSGTNQLHGSAYWFNQNSAYDARDYFNSGPKPGHKQNQDGFSIGGPIVKNKTFFFGDLESVIASNPVNIVATVPTADEINGNFSAAMTYDPNGNLVQNQIYDPFLVDTTDPNNPTRPAYNNNTILPNEIDPVGQAIMKLYPAPNTTPDPTGANNYRDVILSSSNSLQFDIKIDQQFTQKSSLSFRYSNIFNSGSTPTVFGDGEFNDGLAYTTHVYNDGINYSYMPTANTLWTTTFGLDRVSQPSHTNYPSPTSVGFPSYLEQNGVVRMPSIIMEDSQWTSIYDQCCVDTDFAHTLYNYSTSFSWTKGQHTLKAGAEQELFYNNFFQPNYPNGYFSFNQFVTSQSPFDTGNGVQGNDFASLLLGWGDPGGSGINVGPSVADKSSETGFFVQDDWRASSKLTVNLGLRYQWDTPYTERHNNSQFSDFTGDSGISVPGLPSPLLGTTIFASSKKRTVPTDYSNIDPRIGFAYMVNEKTVFRGGAGIYTGYSGFTNFQYPGAAYTASPEVFFSKDGGITRDATLENPFPGGIPPAQGQEYGPLALWGLSNGNNLGTQTAKNAKIYQWNIGIQQALPANVVLAINYSANRSTYLPWAGTDNRNFIPSALRSTETSDQLNQLVNNPFQSLFAGPGAIFNVPSSRYSDAQLPLLNLQRPYPQFDGSFNGYKLISANSWYNALQVVFQRRGGKYLNFEGNYTWSKSMDDSSAGNNDWVGTLTGSNGSSLPQELDHLKREWSVSANDATNRIVGSVIFLLPIGRGYLVGTNMNRVMDAVIGGWQITALATFQSGQPLNIYMGDPRLADGNQRPNLACPASTRLTTGISIHDAGRYGLPWLNSSCFSDPGDQQAGDAPRYFTQIRAPGIREADISLEKIYNLGGRKGQIEAHADCFNCTNTERFGLPDTGYEDSTFGVISSTAGGALPRNMQLGLRYQF
ncbi:MAG TPA: carboxypeptidase-like regulatory domain-containing protein [Acidobacteriaceae bacterium]